jgi:hypothetical protein
MQTALEVERSQASGVGIGRHTVLRKGDAIDMLRGLAEKRSRESTTSIRLLSAG